ncbi:LRR repeats and ubiquitin-like domain-containing protein [Chlorella sorokiniana]|uniref:LRR repeats and ubiquitin-like domain-containing protein n=1 Tax=Chlorella sorokiniana TaxID=3076 RepID=A0A2P6TX03_CHLSO|nr:LRR repeats and ubiquitin-like domain-containing protein [Chlorella sorokiniana]|eukprot:PRW58592.1 LRR repeats and ubiquitin-like domain-containing protein [Chlorella sorokiniana]
MAEDGFPLTVKYGKETLELRLPADATVGQLQTALEERTGLFVRKQKLMAAGKVVSGRPGTLTAAGLRPGAKLMLLAGTGGPTAGQAALEASRQSRQEALERGRQQLAERAAQKGLVAGAAGAAGAVTPTSMRQRAEAWQKTGIAALRDLQLAELPAELFGAQVAAGIRVLDAGGNALAALPPALRQLTGLQRLRLSLNRLTDEGAAWPVLAQLTQLVILAADDNQLTALPPCVSALGRLQKLSLNGNRIASLPDSIGALQQLRALALRGNRLDALPPSLGACSSLVELDLRDNQLAALPEQLGQLTHLKLLLLDNNRLKAVPPAILTGCPALATLSLHGNPLTAEQLRETEGYAAFDARRRRKYDKQVDMRVLNTGFDEGADIVEFEHWNQ